MTDPDVTRVTRNSKVSDPYAELKLIGDFFVWVGLLYVITHPDAFEKLGDTARRYWRKFVHLLSVWTARQDIRSLPETEE